MAELSFEQQKRLDEQRKFRDAKNAQAVKTLTGVGATGVITGSIIPASTDFPSISKALIVYDTELKIAKAELEVVKLNAKKAQEELREVRRMSERMRHATGTLAGLVESGKVVAASAEDEAELLEAAALLNALRVQLEGILEGDTIPF